MLKQSENLVAEAFICCQRAIEPCHSHRKSPCQRNCTRQDGFLIHNVTIWKCTNSRTQQFYHRARSFIRRSFCSSKTILLFQVFHVVELFKRLGIALRGAIRTWFFLTFSQKTHSIQRVSVLVRIGCSPARHTKLQD